MKKVLGIIAALLMLVITVGAEGKGERIQIRFQPELGKTYWFRDLYQETVTQKLPGKAEPQIETTQIEAVYAVDIVRIDTAGAVTMRVTYKSLDYEQKSSDGKLVYKSGDPLENIPLLLMPYELLTSEGFMVKTDPSGRVKVVRGYEPSINEMLKALAAGFGDQTGLSKETLQFMQRLFEDSLSDRALEEKMQDSNIAPSPVAVGGSWKKRLTYTQGFPMIMDAVMTLTQRNQGIASIETVAVLRSNPNAPPPLTFNQMAFRYNFSGQAKGTAKLREADGWSLKTVNERELTGEVQVINGPKELKGQSWPFQLKSTGSTEYIEEPILEDMAQEITDNAGTSF